MSEKQSKYNFRIEDLPRVNLTGDEKLPSTAGLFLSDKVLISFIENPPGCKFPLHSHEAEQIMIILEGEENHRCGDEKFLMKSGDMCVHPSNVPHGGETKNGFKAIDIFCPPREDYVEKLKVALKKRDKK